MTAATGTFYGVPMTAGDIHTVAGNGTPGFSGDGHAAALPNSTSRSGSAWTPRATLPIAGLFDGRVRQASG